MIDLSKLRDGPPPTEKGIDTWVQYFANNCEDYAFLGRWQSLDACQAAMLGDYAQNGRVYFHVIRLGEFKKSQATESHRLSLLTIDQYDTLIANRPRHGYTHIATQSLITFSPLLLHRTYHRAWLNSWAWLLGLLQMTNTTLHELTRGYGRFIADMGPGRAQGRGE